MRWLVVSVDFPPDVGGVSAWAWDAAHALHAGGHTVRVLTRRREGADDGALPFEVRRVWGRSWGRWQATWMGRGAAGLLDSVDAVLVSTWPAASEVARRADRRGLPVYVGAHGSEVTTLEAPPPALQRLAERVRWRPVSHFLAGELARLGVPDDRLQVAPMPLAVDPPVRPWAARAGLACVARPTPLKGVARAARLAGRLDVPLTVVGSTEGPQPREVAVAALGAARAAVLLPHARPSGRGAEGLGLVLLEAAARGVPAIGCPTGGVPEAVGPGLVLADPDHPDLDAVRALLSDPEAGARSRAWVQAHHGPSAFRAALGLS